MPTSRFRRSLAIAAGLALLLALNGSVSTPSVHATDPFTVTSVSCESGFNRYHCDSVVSGGVAPYTYSWQVLGNATITGSSTNSSVSGGCTVNQWFTVGLSAYDSLGAQDGKAGIGLCRSGPWL